jgi:hypothetical protein
MATASKRNSIPGLKVRCGAMADGRLQFGRKRNQNFSPYTGLNADLSLAHAIVVSGK